MVTFNLTRILREKHLSFSELSEMTDISEKNLRLFSSGQVQAVRISTLNRLCEELDCTPGELLGYKRADYLQ